MRGILRNKGHPPPNPEKRYPLALIVGALVVVEFVARGIPEFRALNHYLLFFICYLLFITMNVR